MRATPLILPEFAVCNAARDTSLYVPLFSSLFLSSNGNKLGIAGLVIPVVVFVPVNVLVYVQSLERSSWAPPAYLHYTIGIVSHESPTRPLRLGGAAIHLSASGPTLRRRHSLHRLVKTSSISGISWYVLGVSASKQHRHSLLPQLLLQSGVS